MGLASEWRFGEGNRKSDSCSTELEYNNKLGWSKDYQKLKRHAIQLHIRNIKAGLTT